MEKKEILKKVSSLFISKNALSFWIPALVLAMFIAFLYMQGQTTQGEEESDYKKSGYFEGGNGGSDLDIRRIRWHKHNGFERVVFDCYQYNGVLGKNSYVLSNSVGVYEIGKDKKDALEIDGELKGYRDISAKVPTFTHSKLIDGFEVLPEDGGYLFTIKLKKSTPYRVFTLQNPGRIVIDLKD